MPLDFVGTRLEFQTCPFAHLHAASHGGWRTPPFKREDVQVQRKGNPLHLMLPEILGSYWILLDLTLGVPDQKKSGVHGTTVFSSKWPDPPWFLQRPEKTCLVDINKCVTHVCRSFLKFAAVFFGARPSLLQSMKNNALVVSMSSFQPEYGLLDPLDCLLCVQRSNVVAESSQPPIPLAPDPKKAIWLVEQPSFVAFKCF